MFKFPSLEQSSLVGPGVMPPGEKRSQEEELTKDRRSPEKFHHNGIYTGARPVVREEEKGI